MASTIGITCIWRENEKSHIIRDAFVRAVEEVGGIPVPLPNGNPANAAFYYDMLDGFIFSGGADVDPFYFGEEPQAGLLEIQPERDSFEFALAALALKGTKPVFGVCRGQQLLCAASGGTLYQDIGSITTQQHHQQAPYRYPAHQVDIEEGSRLHRILNKTSLRVNSIHHQAVNQVGGQLRAVGWSKDGIVEAVEGKDDTRFLLGVQWHPEFLLDENSLLLFRAVVEASGNTKTG